MSYSVGRAAASPQLSLPEPTHAHCKTHYRNTCRQALPQAPRLSTQLLTASRLRTLLACTDALRDQAARALEALVAESRDATHGACRALVFFRNILLHRRGRDLCCEIDRLLQCSQARGAVDWQAGWESKAGTALKHAQDAR